MDLQTKRTPRRWKCKAPVFLVHGETIVGKGNVKKRRRESRAARFSRLLLEKRHRDEEALMLRHGIDQVEVDDLLEQVPRPSTSNLQQIYNCTSHVCFQCEVEWASPPTSPQVPTPVSSENEICSDFEGPQEGYIPRSPIYSSSSSSSVSLVPPFLVTSSEEENSIASDDGSTNYNESAIPNFERIHLECDGNNDKDDMTARLLRIQLNHQVSQKGMDDILKLMFDFCGDVVSLKESGERLPCYKSIRRKFLGEVQCNVRVSFSFQNRETGEIVNHEDVSKISVSSFDLTIYEKACESAYFPVQDLVKFFRRVHTETGDHIIHAVMAVDGVQENRTNTVSLLVFALRFQGCRSILPLAIAKSYPGHEIQRDNILDRIVDDLNENNIFLDYVVADAPELKKLGKLQGHGGYHGCSVCTAQAESTRRRNGQHKVAWTVSTLNRMPRTKEHIYECANQNLPIEQSYGVAGISILFKLNHGQFDITKQLLPEVMHMAYHGVTKYLICLTVGGMKLASGTPPPRRAQPGLINKQLRNICNPREFSNRTKPLAQSLKAEESRNIILFYFKVMIDAMETNSRRVIWSILAFVLRAYSLPEKEFDYLDKREIRRLCIEWITLFQTEFGKEFMTYNVHQICHLHEIRKLGPTNETSSFPFEAFFSSMKKCYKTGTVNIGKQILENFILNYTTNNHCCHKSMIICEKKKQRTDDRWIYMYDYVEKSYRFFQIMQALSDGTFLAKRVRVLLHKDNVASTLKWEMVGVYLFDGIEEDQIILSVEEADGKALLCDKLILSVPYATLMENK